jgi:hypothetical protein
MENAMNRRLAVRWALILVGVSVAGWTAVGLGAETKTGSSGFGAGDRGVEKTEGSVVSTTPHSVDLKLPEGQITLDAPKGTAKRTKEIHNILSQLVPDDVVTVTWLERDGHKLIQKIEGRGTIEGTVTARTEVWVDVRPEKGAPQKLPFPWAGRTREEMAKLDQNHLKKIERLRVGDKVHVTWEISDAKRVADVRYLSKAPDDKTEHHTANQHKTQKHPQSYKKALSRARRMGRR